MAGCGSETRIGASCKEQGFIYYTAWSGKQIRKYDRQAGNVVETANVPFYPDNISVRANGMLIVTGMDELQGWKACVLAKRSFCETGFTVMTLDPVNLAGGASLSRPSWHPFCRVGCCSGGEHDLRWQRHGGSTA
jgi:hypothetical protein